jgi:phosphatidylglycerol---prolipoprotein diacylglyceryl transferase
MTIMASIPSPSEGVLHLGPLPLRGYALCIALGVVVAVLLSERRLRNRGAPPGTAADLATVAVPFGIIGARLYHVITTPDPYFGKGGHPIEAFYIWRGGLGIWGAIAAGVLGAWLVIRHRGVPLSIAAEAIAPTLAVAQAFGRWGNWFNQELYGRPSGLPWALHVDPSHRLAGYETVATYQPTFLYESLWCLGVALLCLWADKRFRLGGGRVFALYVAAYTAGRGWIESLRIDTAHRFFGLRLNDYVSVIVFLVAVAYLIKRRGVGDVPFQARSSERVSLTKPADTAKQARDSNDAADTAGAADTADAAVAAHPTPSGVTADPGSRRRET